MPAVAGELALVHGADLGAVQPDVALVAHVHAAQHVQHGGLARAGGPHDDAELPLVDVKSDVVGGGDARFAHLIILAHPVEHHKMVPAVH